VVLMAMTWREASSLAATAARGHSQTTRGYFDFTAPHSPLSSARMQSVSGVTEQRD